MNYDTDYLVIGAGPAGLQLGYGLQRTGARYQIWEASDSVATFFRTMPRFRTLISFNKKHALYDDPEIALRWDWNSLLCDGECLFPDYSDALYPNADDLVRYLEDFAARFVPAITYSRRVVEIDRLPDAPGYRVRAEDGTSLRARAVIVATGFARQHVPPVEGIELVEDTYTNIDDDPADYEGQTVLIIGKGNSAFEVADHLLPTAALVHLVSPQPVRFAWQTRHAGHLRANYVRLLDTYQLKLLNSVLDATVHRIWKEDDAFGVSMTYTHAQGEVDHLRYDRVILCAGFRCDPSILAPRCRPDMVLDGRFPAIDPDWQISGQPDLYVAGTLMQARDFQRAASAFIDGFRYNVRTLFHLLRERYEGHRYPSRRFAAGAGLMVDELLPWICRTSGLWTQFGHLCDVVVVRPGSDGSLAAEHYKELPVDYAVERFADEPHVYQVTFEWGRAADGDVFAIERHPSHDHAHDSAFLHPVLRRLTRGRVVDEHHMLEDLFGMWRPQQASNAVLSHDGRDAAEYHRQEHVLPLRRFFERNFARHES